MPTTLRPYRPTDRAACLQIFDANTPQFFLPPERPEFEAWLNDPQEYLVIERDGLIVGCGGVWRSENRERPAGFAWGMIHPHCQRQGLGRLLTRARLERLRQLGASEVHLDTSQHTASFYAKHGFKEIKRTPDGYGPGLHRIDMIASLN